MRYIKLQWIVAAIVTLPVTAQKNIRLTSPNGNIVFNCKLANKNVLYNVVFKGKTIVDYSSLNLQFDNSGSTGNFKIEKPFFRDTTENYELIVGKSKMVNAHYKEVSIPIGETVSPYWKIKLVVRAFDDGLAFRCEIPQQQNRQDFTLLDEKTTFNLTGDPQVHALLFPNYTSSHEGLYISEPFEQDKRGYFDGYACTF